MTTNLLPTSTVRHSGADVEDSWLAECDEHGVIGGVHSDPEDAVSTMRHHEAMYSHFTPEVETPRTVIARAFNGHKMEYQLTASGTPIQWNATCVDDCTLCADGDERPDW